MEKSKRNRIVAVALIGTALASFAIAGFSLAASSRGPAKSAVFAEVYGYGAWIDVNKLGQWYTLLSIELPYMGQSLYYHVACDGYSAITYAQLKIAIGVDSATEDVSTRRYYSNDDIYRNPSGIHTERVYYLGPGSHTFYFMGAMVLGTGPCRINYHTITVTVFTDGGLTELTGTAQGNVAPDGTPE